MSKQLVMENHVDECLDEVEIRDLFNKKINAINKRITKKQNKIKKLMSK